MKEYERIVILATRLADSVLLDDMSGHIYCCEMDQAAMHELIALLKEQHGGRDVQ